MKPKYYYATEAEIPEDLKDRYVKDGDGWRMDIEGAADATKLKEFRDNNVKLTKEVETLKATFKDIDPEAARKAIEITNQLDEKQLIKATDLAAQVEERTSAMKAANEKLVADITAERDKATAEISTLRINGAVMRAGNECGLREGAADDLISRASRTFSYKDGNVVAADADGNPLFNEKSEPLQIEDWVKQQTEKAPHLFDPNTGGGGQGGGQGGAGGAFNGPNPWDPKSKNMTKQAELLRTNPALAKRLAGKHGVDLPASITSLN